MADLEGVRMWTGDGVSETTYEMLSAARWRLDWNAEITGQLEMSYNSPGASMRVTYSRDNGVHSLMLTFNEVLSVYHYNFDCEGDPCALLREIVEHQESVSLESLSEMINSIVRIYPESFAEIEEDEWVKILPD